MDSLRLRLASASLGCFVLLAWAVPGCGSQVTVFGDCVTDSGTYDVGETFPAGDGCNTCSCDEGGSVSCTEMACDCQGPQPDCGAPPPGCTVSVSCSGRDWSCDVQCDDECQNAPPIDCIAPPGCFYDGIVCVNGSLQCGELICESFPCDEPEPDCPPPFDPNCFSYAYCSELGWECLTECVQPGNCEEQYPLGYTLALSLVVQACGCASDGPCAAACQMEPACFEGGTDVGPACGNCVQNQADMQGACVVNAVLSPACQSDPECSSYINCVLAEG